MSAAASSAATLSPQLEQIRREVEKSSERARRLVESLNEDQLRRRPSPERWSVAECIAHLTKSAEINLPRLDAALSEARERNLRGDGPYQLDFVGGLLKWSLEPPYRMKVKTTAPFEPVEVEPVAQMLPRFLASQSQIVARVNHAQGLALDQVKITSAFNSRVRYNAFAAFHIMLAHVRRHLWQAEQVKAGMGS
ncbi:MAG: DinB family protein [Acidobacteria bacterium]|nr:DinB family protein [Acidobacteriota bacterium]